jgi:hypothetical protein
MKLFQCFAVFAVIIQFVEYVNEIVVLLDAIVTRENRDKCLEPPRLSSIVYHLKIAHWSFCQ